MIFNCRYMLYNAATRISDCHNYISPLQLGLIQRQKVKSQNNISYQRTDMCNSEPTSLRSALKGARRKKAHTLTMNNMLTGVCITTHYPVKDVANPSEVSK
jgi:hypothetical protein